MRIAFELLEKGKMIVSNNGERFLSLLKIQLITSGTFSWGKLGELKLQQLFEQQNN
jgi:hypothetical protein